ncbi:hypothetical protein DYU11_19895 [Fibrisoma montanum]|uniref:Uncharacterized protein n=1 Tax=Fibrisoma montanum TaxID=2305895 RepID=A0A418M3B6_9BACT|nr:hypothetical protein DYU11_19895 [Fibrisoma montanum]
MLTDKDIRDIAAYWGAPCEYRFTEDRRYAQELSLVKNVGIELLQHFHYADILTRTVKLHLRTLSSLTDEEVRECARVALPEDRSKDLFNYEDDVKRQHGKLFLDTFCIHTKGYFYFYYQSLGLHDQVSNSGQLITYLQSIGVYVPGTIREELVQLQQ